MASKKINTYSFKAWYVYNNNFLPELHDSLGSHFLLENQSYKDGIAIRSVNIYDTQLWSLVLKANNSAKDRIILHDLNVKFEPYYRIEGSHIPVSGILRVLKITIYLRRIMVWLV